MLCQTENRLSRQSVLQTKTERPTQNSPQEFLTIQYSVPSSATPQPATDTMWLGKDRGWNSEKRPPKYFSKPLVAIRAQLKDKGKSFWRPSISCRKTLQISSFLFSFHIVLITEMQRWIIERAFLWAQIRIKIYIFFVCVFSFKSRTRLSTFNLKEKQTIFLPMFPSGIIMNVSFRSGYSLAANLSQWSLAVL